MNAEGFQIALQLLGGLALFIYGMNFMSDGLQKAAGDKMKSILEMLTRNVFIGVLAGALATAVLQSSGAVTVMVIGFVSAGLMTLKQAISIIMGANIGTCITAQLVAFQIGGYAWIFVIVGFIMFFFIPGHEKIKEFGQAIFAFGILFTGLNLISDAMEPLAQSAAFADIMLKVADVPILGVLAGAVMTTVVQSSSASIAVLQNLAATAGPTGGSLVGLTGAIPILFGTNIGSTTTALLASIGGTVNAKRTALSHVIFNIVGTLIFIWFTPYIASFVQTISPGGDELDVIARQIANAHLCFNVATTIVFLPLIGVLVKVVTKIIPGGEGDIDPGQPLYLDYNAVARPFSAIYLATKEITRMSELASDMIVATKKGFLGDDLESAEKVVETDLVLNHLRDEIVKYLSSIFSSEAVTEHQASNISGMMHVVSDVEHIGDDCKAISYFSIDKIRKGYNFSDAACAEIYQCFEHAGKMVRDSIEALNTGDVELARAVKEDQIKMENMEEELRRLHLQRLNEKKCSPEFSVVYTDIISDIRRIGDSCDNIANVVLKNINFKAIDEKTEAESADDK